MVDQLNAAVGRNDIDVVSLQFLRLIDLDDRRAGAPCQNLRQFAAVIRIEMHDHDERGAGLIG